MKELTKIAITPINLWNGNENFIAKIFIYDGKFCRLVDCAIFEDRTFWKMLKELPAPKAGETWGDLTPTSDISRQKDANKIMISRHTVYDIVECEPVEILVVLSRLWD